MTYLNDRAPISMHMYVEIHFSRRELSHFGGMEILDEKSQKFP